MAINFTSQILSLYAGSVATEAAYQSPGTYSLPTAFVAATAGHRILTLIEVLRAYFAVIDNTHEAKIAQDVLGRILAAMQFGTPSWNTTTMPAKAQVAALHFLAAHKIPSDI